MGHPRQFSSKSPRSLSYGNAVQNNNSKPFVPPQVQPIALLMPSERKKLAKKQKKKTEKNKAHKIKKSVGAFFHSFKSKKNPKYSQEELSKIAAQKEEYRARHKDEDYYAYYGDPMQKSKSPISPNKMMTNPLSQSYNAQTGSFAKELQILFEDDTIVKVTPDTNMNSVGLIALALEKRGWSSTMSYMFNLCIKGDSPSSNEEIIATLEDSAKIASFPNFISH